MREQMMHRDRREARLDSEPGQVFDDRALHVELALIAQLQQAQAHEGLADGADLEQLVGLHGRARLAVAEPVGRDALHAIAIGEHQRHARRVHVPHELRDVAVELGENFRMAFVGRCSGIVGDEEAAGRRDRCGGDGLQEISTVHGLRNIRDRKNARTAARS